MRQFYLVNEVGTTYFLDYRNETLISDISDIGFERNNVFMEYTHNYKKIDEKFVKKNLVFSLVFTKGYEGYGTFINFVNTSSELRLFYVVDGNKRSADVVFKSITKKELQSEAILSTLTLEQISRWKSKRTYLFTSNKTDTGKRYSYTYPYKYAGSYIGNMNIEVEGDYNAPINVIITGAMNNPTIKFYKDDVEVGVIRLLVSSTYASISICSEETKPHIKMLENDEERNIYSLQDFDADNFIKLKKGNYRVEFNPGVAKRVSCSITVNDIFGGQ